MRKLIPAVAVAIIGVAAVLFYMAVDRHPPYDYIRGEVLPPDPVVGGQISVHWRVRVNRYCPGWVERYITDRRGYIWHNIGTPVKDIRPVAPGQKSDIINTFDLPRQLGQGPATYQARACYSCNPLQEWARWPICVDTPKVLFEIR